jgi:hypothetical protein
LPRWGAIDRRLNLVVPLLPEGLSSDLKVHPNSFFRTSVLNRQIPNHRASRSQPETDPRSTSHRLKEKLEGPRRWKARRTGQRLEVLRFLLGAELHVVALAIGEASLGLVAAGAADLFVGEVVRHPPRRRRRPEGSARRDEEVPARGP